MSYLLIVIALIYTALVAGMYLFQRKLMYLPMQNIGVPEQYGLSGFSEDFVTTSDGVKVHLWYRPAATGFPTIVYFHGNAGHMGDRSALFAALVEKDFGLLALSYRGYGKSEGAPSEQGLYSDARAAISYLLNNKHVPLGKLILFGESLGTGVATQMATQYDISMLILQAPYRSVSGRAGEIYYFIPVKQLIKDKFQSIKKIARVKAPLLIFHGEQDDVIPVRHGKTMFEAATSPKRAHFMPGIKHNDFDSSVISAHVLDYAKEHRLVP